jgi:hypothetical protein
MCSLGGVAFTADGTGAITGCEARGRPLRVVLVDAAIGAERARYDEIPRDREMTARTA